MSIVLRRLAITCETSAMMKLRLNRTEVVGKGGAPYLWIEAWSGRKKIGYVESLLNQRVAHIEFVSVKDAFRRRGVGTRLLRRFLLEARSDGREAVTAQVEKKNEASMQMIEKCGFTKIDDGGSHLLYAKSCPLLHRESAGDLKLSDDLI